MPHGLSSPRSRPQDTKRDHEGFGLGMCRTAAPVHVPHGCSSLQATMTTSNSAPGHRTEFDVSGRMGFDMQTANT